MNGLENLKKGDRVTIIQHRFGDPHIRGGFEVDHITTTLVVSKPTPCGIGDPIPGTRVKIATGKELGFDLYSSTSYYASTDPCVAAIRKAREDAKELAVMKASVESAVKSSSNKTALINALKSLITAAEQPATPATQPEQPEQTAAVA